MMITVMMFKSKFINIIDISTELHHLKIAKAYLGGQWRKKWQKIKVRKKKRVHYADFKWITKQWRNGITTGLIEWIDIQR